MNQALYRQRFNKVEGNRNFVPVNVEQPTGSDDEPVTSVETATPTAQAENITPTAVISEVDVQPVAATDPPVQVADPLPQAMREKVLAIMTDPAVTDLPTALAQYASEQDLAGYDHVLDCVMQSDMQLYDDVVKHLDAMNNKAS